MIKLGLKRFKFTTKTGFKTSYKQNFAKFFPRQNDKATMSVRKVGLFPIFLFFKSFDNHITSDFGQVINKKLAVTVVCFV